MTTSSSAHFSLSHVSVQFDRCCALDDVSLTFQRGERAAIVGPSGAGKSTLLGLLNGTVPVSAGSVCANGVDLSSMSQRALRAHRAEVGFIYQRHHLIPSLRVLQNVLGGQLGRRSFFGALRALVYPSTADCRKVFEILEQVGISEKMYQPTARLSGGQQQRVAVARALFQKPTAILADEPVSSVDPARASETLRLFCEIAERRNLTLAVSLHDVQLAREYFPRIIGLRQGRVIFDLPSDEVEDLLLGELFSLSTTLEELGND